MNKLLLINLAFILYLVLAIGAIFILPQAYVIPFILIFSFGGIYYFAYFISKHLSQKIDKKSAVIQREVLAEYQQIEALFAIYNLLKIDSILPPFRGWAVSPDFGSLLLKTIKNNKSKNIIECGSGVSTLIISYLIKEQGFGHLYTLEHDREYGEKTMEQLRKNGLQKYVTLIDTKLITQTINNKQWLWYDFSEIDHGVVFDVLIVDGPPTQVQKHSRYPALPLLNGQMSKDAVILIDDCKREDDKYVVERWISEYSDYKEEYIDTEKGAYILTRTKSKPGAADPTAA